MRLRRWRRRRWWLTCPSCANGRSASPLVAGTWVDADSPEPRRRRAHVFVTAPWRKLGAVFLSTLPIDDAA